MTFTLKLVHKGIILVAVPLVFECAFVMTLVSLLKQSEHQLEVELHSKEVIASANGLMRSLVDATTAAGGYNITGSDFLNQRSINGIASVRQELAKLKILLKGKPLQQENLARIEKAVGRGLAIVNDIKISDASPVSLRGLVGSGQTFRDLNKFISEIGAASKSLVLAEENIERQSPASRAQTQRLIELSLASGLILNVVLAVALAIFFMNSTTRRLGIVMDNTRRLAKKQELNQAVSGQDEIAELDQAFHLASDELKELEEFKQRLIGIVSHELKTPLNSMQVSLALMSAGATGELPERAVKKVQAMEINVGRLIRLIGDLLDIEKLQSGKFELDRKEFDLDAAVESSVEAVKAFAEEHHVKIECLEGNLKAFGDLERVIQIIVNLLSNAIKYSPEDSVIKVETGESGSSILLKVVDNGRGIPDNQVNEIFERFHQIDRADDTARGGTGLGLSICKTLVEAHGGKIGVVSQPAQGSTFWFSLPKQETALDKA